MLPVTRIRIARRSFTMPASPSTADVYPQLAAEDRVPHPFNRSDAPASEHEAREGRRHSWVQCNRWIRRQPFADVPARRGAVRLLEVVERRSEVCPRLAPAQPATVYVDAGRRGEVRLRLLE